jgi:hypothetical protein
MRSKSNHEFASTRAWTRSAIEVRMPKMRFYLAVFIAVTLAIEAQVATGDQVTSSSVESLGEKLLDDLSPTTPQPVAPPSSSPKRKATKQIEDSLKASTPLHSFGAGASAASQSLARVGNSMEQAQSKLSQTAASGKADPAQLAGPVQHEILSDLDKLIADLSKQCQCCNGQCQGGQCNQPPKPGQNSKPGKPGSSAGRGRSAARDSTDRLDSSSAKPVEKGEMNEIVKALWGHLPERGREQMLQSFSDEFLPKYELEIEQYYRRLSEEQGESQAK